MTWILGNIKLIGILSAIIGLLGIGWHSHTIWDGYKARNALETAVVKARAGETKIIHDTQVITKVIHDSKNVCADQPMPDALIEQLRK